MRDASDREIETAIIKTFSPLLHSLSFSPFFLLSLVFAEDFLSKVTNLQVGTSIHSQKGKGHLEIVKYSLTDYLMTMPETELELLT